jgi:peroxiredoxin
MVAILLGEDKLSRMKTRKRSKVTRPKRSTRRGLLIFAATIVVVLAVAAYIMSQPPHQAASIGDIAPDFTLHVVGVTGLSDQSVTLSSFRGKVVVLEFMVSWCHYCQEMAPSVESLNQKYRGQDVVFLSVAGTADGATAESTAEFIEQYRSTWTYVLDADGSVFKAYGVEATPQFLILDRSGRIASRFQGAVATDTFSNAIDLALS